MTDETLTQKEKQKHISLIKIISYVGTGIFLILGILYFGTLLIYCIQQFLQGNW